MHSPPFNNRECSTLVPLELTPETTMSHPVPYRKRPRNPSPPISPNNHGRKADEPKRKIRNVTSAADQHELQQHYTFVPSGSNNTWQDRMVNQYHSHLYKEYVLADLTRAPAMLGLRWRTEQEVQNGRGHATCGNKHCLGQALELLPAIESLLSRYHDSSPPSSTEQEEKLLEKLPHGVGLHDYEVPFTYTEQEETKTELVKLRLCLRCSPLLFKGGALEARLARSKRNGVGDGENGNDDNNLDNDSPHEADERKRANGSNDSNDSEKARRKRRHKHKKKKRKHRHH